MFNQNHDINRSFIKDEDIDLAFDKLESKEQSKDNFDQVQRISYLNICFLPLSFFHFAVLAAKASNYLFYFKNLFNQNLIFLRTTDQTQVTKCLHFFKQHFLEILKYFISQ